MKRAGPYAIMCACYVLLAGCGSQTPPGDTITVEAPPNDTVTFEALPTAASCCPTPPCNNIGHTPVPSGPVDSAGLVQVGPFQHMEDGTNWEIASDIGAPTACYGYTTSLGGQCGATFTLTCSSQNPNAAQGAITVNGTEQLAQEQKCTHWLAGGDCENWYNWTQYDSGTISLTFDGQTVTVSYSQNSTAAVLAAELAIAIDQNATLSSQFTSAAIGPVSYVHALNAGSNYPWTSSCTYNSKYFDSCSFTTGLSPAGSLSAP